MSFSLGKGGRKTKTKEGKERGGEKERKGEETTKSERDSKLSEELTTRQGPLNKSASKAIAVHTAKPVIDGGGDGSGPLINWDIAPYLRNHLELTCAKGPAARGIRGAGDLKGERHGPSFPRRSSPWGAGLGARPQNLCGEVPPSFKEVW